MNLNSTYTKMIVALGTGAIGALSALIPGVSLGAGTGSFLGSLLGASIDTSKDMYIDFQNMSTTNSAPLVSPIGRGYQ